MYTFYITWIVSFASYCSSLTETSELIVSWDSENKTRCDTYTYTQTHEINYIWAIHEFTQQQTFGTKILSPILRTPTTNRYQWRIEFIFVPNRTANGTEAIAIRIFLSNSSAVEEMLAMTNVGFVRVNATEKQILIDLNNTKLQKFTKGEAGVRSTSYLCRKTHLYNCNLLQNDTLTLLIQIRPKWSSEPSIRLPNTSICAADSASTSTPETTIIKRNLSENLESMLENAKFADVVFVPKGSNYPTREAILGARTPVFAAVFQEEDSKNASSKKIQINVTHINEKFLRESVSYWGNLR
ncbi:speckle-type POZ protein-like [Planococcus citri]|uniref:speckle-type POZ protein-like n=1 Tax=Planococcus citri TaxID=170843 RepID=UPI0031F74ED6